MRAVILALLVTGVTVAPSFAQNPPAPAPGAAAQAPAAAAPAAVPNARVFNGGAGLILYTIKPASTTDFEAVLKKTKEALMKSEKPERKQQAANWRVYKSDQTAANGNVTYVMIIDPALKDADYNIVNIMNEAFPAEIQALFKSYTESFASGLIPINLLPVVDYGK